LLDIAGSQIGFVKFQSAFFEALGSKGIEVLSHGIALAKKKELGVILDAKRGDIGSTATAYARAYLTPARAGSLSDLEVDCLTVNPFLGPETLEPFVDCARRYGKGIFFLVKTSNPGAGWLQDRMIDGCPVSDHVATLVASWTVETKGICGISSIGAVVGATVPKDGRRLRALMPDSIFLAPGLGVQGGKPDDIRSLRRPNGSGVLVPVSRGVTKADRSISMDAYALLIQERIAAYQESLRRE
jgi:orotidine-5'-phosphate decarboxylase